MISYRVQGPTELIQQLTDKQQQATGGIQMALRIIPHSLRPPVSSDQYSAQVHKGVPLYGTLSWHSPLISVVYSYFSSDIQRVLSNPESFAAIFREYDSGIPGFHKTRYISEEKYEWTIEIKGECARPLKYHKLLCELIQNIDQNIRWLKTV